MDIGSWLRDLGLEKYERVFLENAVDFDVIPELTEDDLEKLGVALGDRKRLIRAIRAMAGSLLGAATKDEGRESSEYSPVAAGERRHLTVMICDLVGSTVLSGRLNPTCGDHRYVSPLLHRIDRAQWRFCRKVHGRWRACLFRLSPGPRA